jgi:hypothetical protein
MQQAPEEPFTAFAPFVLHCAVSESDLATHTVQLRHNDVHPRVWHIYCNFSAIWAENALREFIIQGYTNDAAWCVFEYINFKSRDPDFLVGFVIDVDYDPNKVGFYNIEPPPPVEEFVEYISSCMREWTEIDEDERYIVLVSDKKPPCVSYHIRVPANWHSDSGCFLQCMKLLFEQSTNQNAKRFRPYVDFAPYAASAHSLRAPLCDRMHLEAVEPMMRPFRLHSVYDLHGVQDEEAQQYFSTNLGRLYSSSCMRVRARDPTVIKGRLRDSILMSPHQHFAESRISRGASVAACSNRIDLAVREYWSDEIVDRIISDDRYDSPETRTEALVREMNKYFGFVRYESSSKMIIMKYPHELHNYPSIKNCTDQHIYKMFSNKLFPIAAKKRKRTQTIDRSKATNKRRRGSSKRAEQNPEEHVAEATADDVEEETIKVNFVCKNKIK